MIYYHATRQLLSIDAPRSDQVNRFQHWDKRADPAEAYIASGWTPCPESSPEFDGSPLTGRKARTVAADGLSWSWTVSGEPWQTAIDVLRKSKQQARSAIDAAMTSSQQATIPYTLPVGATLQGNGAEGQEINLWMIHPDVQTYWVDYKSMMDARGMYSVEEFDSVDGRVTVDGEDMQMVLAAVARAGSYRRTAWRRLEAKYKTATTVAEFDSIRQAIKGE